MIAFFKTRDWQTNRTKVSEMNVMNFLPCWRKPLLLIGRKLSVRVNCMNCMWRIFWTVIIIVTTGMPPGKTDIGKTSVFSEEYWQNVKTLWSNSSPIYFAPNRMDELLRLFNTTKASSGLKEEPDKPRPETNLPALSLGSFLNDNQLSLIAHCANEAQLFTTPVNAGILRSLLEGTLHQPLKSANNRLVAFFRPVMSPPSHSRTLGTSVGTGRFHIGFQRRPSAQTRPVFQCT